MIKDSLIDPPISALLPIQESVFIKILCCCVLNNLLIIWKPNNRLVAQKKVVDPIHGSVGF